MFEEPTVDTQPMTEQSATDDALQAVTQEEEVGQSLSEALDQLMADDPATHEDDAPQPDKESEGDAGIDKGIKGRFKSYEAKGEKRGYERGKAEAEAAWAKERQAYEERLAKLQNLELQDEAKKLAAEEKITEKLAMRILRAERGLAPQADAAKKPTVSPHPASGKPGCATSPCAPSCRTNFWQRPTIPTRQGKKHDIGARSHADHQIVSPAAGSRRC